MKKLIIIIALSLLTSCATTHNDRFKVCMKGKQYTDINCETCWKATK